MRTDRWKLVAVLVLFIISSALLIGRVIPTEPTSSSKVPANQSAGATGDPDDSALLAGDLELPDF